MAFETVINRRKIPVEQMFDGSVIVWQPGERKCLPSNIAQCVVAGSGLQMNLETGVTTVYALGIEGSPAFPCDPLDGALADTNAVEILDRSDSLLNDAAMVMDMDRRVPVVPKDEHVTTGKTWAVVQTGVKAPRGSQNPRDFSDSQLVMR